VKEAEMDIDLQESESVANTKPNHLPDSSKLSPPLPSQTSPFITKIEISNDDKTTKINNEILSANVSNLNDTVVTAKAEQMSSTSSRDR
jgi:hypothetical protein